MVLSWKTFKEDNMSIGTRITIRTDKYYWIWSDGKSQNLTRTVSVSWWGQRLGVASILVGRKGTGKRTNSCLYVSERSSKFLAHEQRSWMAFRKTFSQVLPPNSAKLRACASFSGEISTASTMFIDNLCHSSETKVFNWRQILHLRLLLDSCMVCSRLWFGFQHTRWLVLRLSPTGVLAQPPWT